MESLKFRTANGDSHLIDSSGNHFVNNRCVNPVKPEEGLGDEIGSTYPPESSRIFS